MDRISPSEGDDAGSIPAEGKMKRSGILASEQANCLACVRNRTAERCRTSNWRVRQRAPTPSLASSLSIHISQSFNSDKECTRRAIYLRKKRYSMPMLVYGRAGDQPEHSEECERRG